MLWSCFKANLISLLALFQALFMTSGHMAFCQDLLRIMGGHTITIPGHRLQMDSKSSVAWRTKALPLTNLNSLPPS